MASKYLKILINGLLLFLFIGMIGCSVNNDTPDDQGYAINNDETNLEIRLTDRDSEIDVVSEDTTVGKAVAKRSFALHLIADVDAPVVNDVQTQATMVHVFGNSARAAASYNVQGNDYIGAVDALQITSSGRNAIRVRSGIEFTNAKTNAVFINENNIWLAHSSEDPLLTKDAGFSAARMFGFSGFNINDNPVSAGLPGFAANSIHQSDDRLYVTSGNNAGLTIFEDGLSNHVTYLEIPGARWVDTDENRIVVLSADPESNDIIITVLDKSDHSEITSYSYTFENAVTSQAKSTVEIHGDLALVAANRSGTHLIDLNTGDLIANIPVPDAESLGLNEDVVETNAASADEEFIFISNGEAGVYVAEASKDLASYTSGDEFSVELIGNLKFNDFESANHVAFRNSTLFVAAGLGGVKAVQLSRK
ncbi:hypothetical protein DYD21_13615 [Rhodohalobacter sp. SW132]|uniref:hypothetical protein n=1 Tax=Rhodohalobacter sp. SW132 TaxID=2293433 RepID=UPI000E27B439|nr:hypothetical protein [Rhodohalobacter sp. SW132]REL32856.1 hypothetical protein DYD21_13615 [Rhodohalobacter sp. SW132]